MIPYGINTEDVTAELADGKKVVYEIDENTSYEYELTYTGIKENIVVKNNTGVTEYRFLVRTHGYTLENREGILSVLDGSGKTKATMDELCIYASDGSTCSDLEYEITENEYREKYTVTIRISEDYINSASYPIVIDPTVSVTLSDSSEIMARTIYSNHTSTSASGTILNVGTGNFGEARILMSFPGLSLTGLDNTQIVSAFVEMTNVYSSHNNDADTLIVNCHKYNGNWSSSSQWTSVNPDNYDSSVLSYNYISYEDGMDQYPEHRYSFDIADAVVDWVNGEGTKENGVIFIGDTGESENTIRKIFDSPFAGSDQPSVVLTYNTESSRLLPYATYYMNNKDSGQYLKYADSQLTSSSGYTQNLGSPIQWTIDYCGGYYMIHPYGNASLYLSSGQNGIEIGTSDGNTIPDSCKWSITLATGGGCLIRNVSSRKWLGNDADGINEKIIADNYGTESYNSRIWRIANTALFNENRQLDSATINDIEIFIGETAIPVITKNPENAIWSEPGDFEYTNSSYSYDESVQLYSLNTINGEFRGIDVSESVITATHKVTGLVSFFKIEIMDSYYQVLRIKFGFSSSTAIVLHRLAMLNASDTLNEFVSTSWQVSRALGGIEYDNNSSGSYADALHQIGWTLIAGSNSLTNDQLSDILQLSESEFRQFVADLLNNHSSECYDFVHMQMSLASRLWYYQGNASAAASIYLGCSPEYVSYYGGWFGDAVNEGEVGCTSIPNGDYCADLDAENIYRMIISNDYSTLLDVYNIYYEGLSTSNRAVQFTSHSGLDSLTVKNAILNYLNCTELELCNQNHDTYQFIIALENQLDEME